MVHNSPPILLEEMKLLKEMQEQNGARKPINSELWHACAGPLASLPQVGSLVYYFPQGHIEQVAVSTKRSATSQIPNYPNLPSQLMCQIHNVTLHADKDTDEIFAQMSLQPVKSEKDVFPVPEFGMWPSKHPTEFFCKTLTASDTSTHGGFSVPRRAAEKLFPPLDYTMQPPMQELVVRDLHDNMWTFRHIYRGQPKRHLLTTGWSVFVGSKRLRAGDAVLFIRDEKGQLMLGVRRANRQQTALPSSVLSADSMHIGVLAAAAHAAANRTPFTVFYNPRACPADFVIPASKYRKAVYGTQLSVGMRFGMMVETEDSSKTRYMGTLVGTSDLDPLRWPGSKWRNLQVEWDEPGCGDKQTRVSAWDIETPESLFLFPSLTSGFKRPFYPALFGGELEWGNLMKRPSIQIPESGNRNLPYPSIPNLGSEQLLRILTRPQHVSQATGSLQPPLKQPENQTMKIIEPGQDQEANKHPNQAPSTSTVITKSEASKSETVPEPDRSSQLTSTGQCIAQKTTSTMSNPIKSQNPGTQICSQTLTQQQLESSAFHPQQVGAHQSDLTSLNGLLPFIDSSDWLPHVSSFQSVTGLPQTSSPYSMFGKQDLSVTIPEVVDPVIPLMGQDSNPWVQTQNLNNTRFLSQADQFCSYTQTNSTNLRDLSDETNTQSGIYSCLDLDGANSAGTMVDAALSNSVLNDICPSKEGAFYSSDCLVGNFGSSQDLQSQITSASLADSQAFSLQEYPDNSGGTSSSNVDFDECSLLQNGSWQQIAPPMRTYTKVQKAGSVGRSIDVTSFKNYNELRLAIERMFGLDGLLNDPRGSGWKLVYVDFENDVLLVGDDPWEEFVNCVRCIRILSPSEVHQMSEEGMQLLNGTAIPPPINAS